MEHKKTYLGIGWKFPPVFNRNLGSVEMISEENDINESLFILLSTRPGERTMMPTYGCDLSFLLFENMDATLINRMKNNISQAILKFEPRITLEDIAIDTSRVYDGVLQAVIIYTVNQTNSRSNFVFPYYLIEGTNLKQLESGE
jgi:hypothetical protein